MPMADALDQARQTFQQLTSQAGNVVKNIGQGVQSAAVTPGPTGQSPLQVVQQYGPQMPQYVGNTIRAGLPPSPSQFSDTPIGRTYDQIIQQTNKAIQPIMNFAGNIGQAGVQGASDWISGTNQAVNGKDVLDKVGGAAKAVYGVGQGFAAASPLFTGANAVTSFTPQVGQADLPRRVAAGVMQGMTGNQQLNPNVPSQNTNLPVLGQSDIAKGIGSMVGFTQNPVNKLIFGATEGLNIGLKNPITNFVLSNGLKGGVENTLMTLGEMPTTASLSQKAQYLLKNFGLGAAMNIGVQGTSKGVGAVAKKIGESEAGQFTTEQLGKAYDELQNFTRKWNTPVKTMEMNEQTGQFTTRPMWQQKIMDGWKAYQAMSPQERQRGGINFGADIGLPSQPNTESAAQPPSENPASGNDFLQSLGNPTDSSAAPVSPPNMAQSQPEAGASAVQTPPEAGLGSAMSADLPQTPPAGSQTPTTPETPHTQLQISSDGSISSPSNQAAIDQAFANAKITKDTPLSGGHELVKAVANIFDPVAGTVQGADITNAFQNHRAVFDLAQQQAAKASENLTQNWDKVPPQQHLSFIQGIESGNPSDVPGMPPGLAAQYQQRFADDYKIQQSIRPDAPYRENYFTQSGIWQDPQKASEFYNKWQQAQLGGSKGFFEQRTFPTVLDGVKAGLTLKETNPETLYLNNHTQVLKAKMADDFAKEAQTKGYDPSLVQKVIDRYMDPGIANNAIYKTARAANAALNSFQLGLSAFHFTTTTMNAFTSRMAQGIEELSQGHAVSGLGDIASTPVAPLQMILKGNKMLSDAFADNPQLSSDVQNVLTGGGKLGGQNDVYKVGAWNDMMKNIRQGQVIPAALKLPFAVMEKITSPLMDWYVPRMKLGAFADLASSKFQNLGENPTPETQRAALGQAWDSIDNRFGQLVQDKLLWNKTFKDISNLSTRSVGWNLGTIREIGGGAINLKNAPGQIVSGKGISSNTAYTLALPVMTAIGAFVYSYLHGTPLASVKDFFAPRTGQTVQPKPNSPDQTAYPERVTQPGYAKDVYAFAKNPVSTLLNKTSPLLGLIGKAVELGQTGGIKDYFGNQVVSPTAPPLEKAGQIAKYGASQFTPFSFSGQKQRVGQDPETKVESALGFQPAPASITKGNNADLLNQAYNNKLTPAQAKQLFQMQQQGINPQSYLNSITDQRAQSKQARTAGTDLYTQKDNAVKAALSGDYSQAQKLGLTNQGMKLHIKAQMLSAADALVAGDTQTAQKLEQTYHSTPDATLMSRAARDRGVTLLQQAGSYHTQGDTQSEQAAYAAFDAMRKQYPFQFTPQDKQKIIGTP